MTPVAIGDIQRTQGTLKTVCKAKNRYRHLLLCLHGGSTEMHGDVTPVGRVAKWRSCLLMAEWPNGEVAMRTEWPKAKLLLWVHPNWAPCNQLYRLRFAHQFLAQMPEAKVS